MQESTGSIIVAPRAVATGSPIGDSLENLNTNILANGVLCYVHGGPGQGEWQLQKESTAAPNGTTIVAPISGPGRWFLKLGPGVPGATVFAQRYTVGPVSSGSEFQTVQAAVNAAAAVGGAAEFFIYPVFYNENVVVPNTLTRCYFVGAGGQVGSYINSLTINRTAAVEAPFFSIENVGFTNLTVAGTANGAAELRGVTIFGLTTVNAPGLELRGWGCRFIRTGQLWNFTGARLELNVCDIQSGGGATVAILSAATAATELKWCEIFGEVHASGLNFTMNGCEHFFNTRCVLDSCTGDSEIMGNQFNALSASNNHYEKTGASSLEEIGNSFGFLSSAPFWNVTAGSYRGSKLSADEVRARAALGLGGSAQAVLLNATSAASIATDRFLVWDGTQTIYRDASLANYSLQFSTGLSATILNRSHRTVGVSAGATINLPNVSAVNPGARITFKNHNGGTTATPATINAGGLDSIDGGAAGGNIQIATDYGFVTLQANSTVNQWLIVGQS